MSPFRLNDITILTVHYHTPWLLESLYNSIRKFYKLPIIVVENSTDPKIIALVKLWSRKVKKVKIVYIRRNIRHGPGINLGIKHIKTPLVLCIDTDVRIKKIGYIEKLVNGMQVNSYGAGMVTWITPKGLSTKPRSKNAIRYLHPHFMLLNIKEYNKYYPAANHGAPMIYAMKHIKKKNHEHKLVNIRGKTHYEHLWRGTVARRKWLRSI